MICRIQIPFLNDQWFHCRDTSTASSFHAEPQRGIVLKIFPLYIYLYIPFFPKPTYRYSINGYMYLISPILTLEDRELFLIPLKPSQSTLLIY